MKLYEINLLNLMDLIQTHYAVGFDMSNPGAVPASGYQSMDTVYKDPQDFARLGIAVAEILHAQYQPFKYSDLRVENGRLYYPVSDSTTLSRFGPVLYDSAAGQFCFNLSKVGAQSLVVLDYTKYMGRSLSTKELEDLDFMLNHYRSGRSPLAEVKIFNNIVGVLIDRDSDVDELLGTLFDSWRRERNAPLLETYMADLTKLGQLMGASSTIMRSQSTVPTTSQTPVVVKVAPLLVILGEFLGTINSQSSSTSISSDLEDYKVQGLDEDTYHDWVQEIFEAGGVSPGAFGDRLSNEKFTAMVFIFQFIASRPGVIEKLRSSGNLVVDGAGDSEEVARMYSARNKTLEDSVWKIFNQPQEFMESSLLCNTLRHTIYSGSETNAKLTTFYDRQFQKMPLVRQALKDRRMYEEIEVLLSLDYPNSAVRSDFYMCAEVANSGLVPLAEAYSFEDALIDYNMPGLGRGNFAPELAKSAQYMVGEELRVMHEYDVVARDDKSSSSIFHIPPSLLGATEMKKVSVRRDFAESLDSRVDDGLDYNYNVETTYHLLNKTGSSAGVIDPLLNRYSGMHIDSQSAEDYANRLVKFADEHTSTQKGEWYKMSFQSVKSARSIAKRIVATYKSRLK